MSELVKVRPAKGKRRVFEISRGLFEKYPDHYVEIVPKITVAKDSDAE